jgi:hypothetical protein
LSPADPTVSPAFAPPLNYYVRFTRFDGSIVTLNGGQFFALPGFSFGDTQIPNIGSQSSGAGAGTVTFNPLQLNFSQQGLQPELFNMLASGAAFKEVDVLGYSQGTNHLVTDDSFGLVAADKLSIDGTGVTQVGLEYDLEAIQQSVQQPDGSFSTPVADSWSRLTDTSDFRSTPVAAPITLSPADPTVSPAFAPPLNYYVRFTRFDGSVVTLNGGQFFALPGFSFGDTQILNIGSQSSGVTQVGLEYGSAAISIMDPGPTASSGAVTEGHGQTISLSALIAGLITPGIAGDTETLTSVSATLGTATLGANNAVSYTAPAAGPDTISYTVQDQYGDTATGTVAVTVDPGPTAGSRAVTEGHGQTVSLSALIAGLITPGIVGDTETLTSVSAALGTAILGANNAVSYTAPAAGPDTIRSRISMATARSDRSPSRLIPGPRPATRIFISRRARA